MATFLQWEVCQFVDQTVQLGMVYKFLVLLAVGFEALVTLQDQSLHCYRQDSPHFLNLHFHIDSHQQFDWCQQILLPVQSCTVAGLLFGDEFYKVGNNFAPSILHGENANNLMKFSILSFRHCNIGRQACHICFYCLEVIPALIS